MLFFFLYSTSKIEDLWKEKYCLTNGDKNISKIKLAQDKAALEALTIAEQQKASDEAKFIVAFLKFISDLQYFQELPEMKNTTKREILTFLSLYRASPIAYSVAPYIKEEQRDSEKIKNISLHDLPHHLVLPENFNLSKFFATYQDRSVFDKRLLSYLKHSMDLSQLTIDVQTLQDDAKILGYYENNKQIIDSIIEKFFYEVFYSEPISQDKTLAIPNKDSKPPMSSYILYDFFYTRPLGSFGGFLNKVDFADLINTLGSLNAQISQAQEEIKDITSHQAKISDCQETINDTKTTQEEKNEARKEIADLNKEIQDLQNQIQAKAAQEAQKIRAKEIKCIEKANQEILNFLDKTIQKVEYYKTGITNILQQNPKLTQEEIQTFLTEMRFKENKSVFDKSAQLKENCDALKKKINEDKDHKDWFAVIKDFSTAFLLFEDAKSLISVFNKIVRHIDQDFQDFSDEYRHITDQINIKTTQIQKIETLIQKKETLIEEKQSTSSQIEDKKNQTKEIKKSEIKQKIKQIQDQIQKTERLIWDEQNKNIDLPPEEETPFPKPPTPTAPKEENNDDQTSDYIIMPKSEKLKTYEEISGVLVMSNIVIICHKVYQKFNSPKPQNPTEGGNNNA